MILQFIGKAEYQDVYLTSFIHRNDLFDIAERWFCNRPDREDARDLTGILICDGFVIAETLDALSCRLMEIAHERPFHTKKISLKGELREIICQDKRDSEPRVAELVRRYRSNPDYYYKESPINAAVYLDEEGHLLGSSRIKRPKRIAEKANRRIADWIFANVLGRAEEMARERARLSGVPLERFVTPAEEMASEFIRAEEFIAGSFRDGSIRFDRVAMTIHDVAALKIVADKSSLERLENTLMADPEIRIVEREDFRGNYRATNLIIEVPCDTEHICRQYIKKKAWEKYCGRGISKEELGQGLEPFLSSFDPSINVEVILSTFPDMVESELGSSIHEERIILQRDTKRYRGYIPMNVEFLVESLFAVGFSPRVDIEKVPIKLWGRYLPETLGMFIRQLYRLPDHDLIH